MPSAPASAMATVTAASDAPATAADAPANRVPVGLAVMSGWTEKARPGNALVRSTARLVAPEQCPRNGPAAITEAACAMWSSGTHSKTMSAARPSKPRPWGPVTWTPTARRALASALPRRPAPTTATDCPASPTGSGDRTGRACSARPGNRPTAEPVMLPSSPVCGSTADRSAVALRTRGHGGGRCRHGHRRDVSARPRLLRTQPGPNQTFRTR